jgi:hypothetical protein
VVGRNFVIENGRAVLEWNFERISAIFLHENCAFDRTNCNVRSAIFHLSSTPSTYLPPSNYFHAAWNFMLVQYVRRSATHHVLSWSGNSKVLSGNACFVFPGNKLFVQRPHMVVGRVDFDTSS